jgi:hypothetical protein
MVKPWKGSKGRAATAQRKLTKTEFAIKLRDQQPHLTQAQLAASISEHFKLKKPITERHVRRYLNGR